MMYNEVLKEKYMKETIVACATGLLLFGMLFASMVFDNQTKYKCTVAGMMAGYSASEIRAICNVR
jgi:hypothetical protein